MNKFFVKRLAVGAAVLVAAGGTTALTTGSANAADPTEPPASFTAVYDASGSSHVTKGNFDVPLGPTKLTADVSPDPNGTDLDFNAALPLPPKTVSFKAFGYLPVRAKVYFTQVGPATGVLSNDAEGNFTARANAKYVLTLRDVYVGYTAAKVGDNCQTRYPIDVDVANGPGFNLGGGDLVGTYDIGKFNNCSTSTDLANLIVPSNDNTIKLTLSNLNLLDGGTTPTLRQAKAQIKKLQVKK